jgi:hypothetical protein
MDIDLRPESFKHHHLRAVPEKYRHQVDVRTFGTGERIVFLPYTREVFAATQAWTRRVFPALPEPAPYDEAVLLPRTSTLDHEIGTNGFEERHVMLEPFR